MKTKPKRERQFRLALACGTATIALLAPPVANAQDASKPTLLQEIRIEGSDTTGVEPVRGVVAKSTRTGSKTATALNEVPQSVTVVGREQIDDQSPQKIDEALRYVAGVNPSTYGTDSDTDWLFIRGFQADQTGMFLDGLSLFQTGFGTFLVDPFFVERIEVIKGPSSVLYGGASPGGFVNFISKRPTDEPLHYVETGINSFGNGYLGLDFSDKLGSDDVLSYRLTGKISGGGWETDRSDDFRGTIAPSITWKPDEDTSLTILSSYQNVDLTHTSTGFLPYEGTVVDRPGVGRIPRDLFYGDESRDVYERQQAMIGYEFEHTFDNNWTVRQNLRYASVSLKEDALYANGWSSTDPTKLARYRFAHDTDVGIFTVDNQLEGEFTTGPLDHNLLLGLDYRHYSLDHTQAVGFRTDDGLDLDPLNPVYGGVDIPGLNNPYLDQDLKRDQLGIYAQDQIKFGDGWIATLNARYDYVSTDLDDRVPPITTSNSADSEEGEFTWRAALAYEFANGLTPYASYSTSYNPTTTTDPDDGLLPSETGKQWEIGVKYEPGFMDALITAAYFDITRENVANTEWDGEVTQAYAVGEVTSRGFETAIQANIASGWKAIGSLTYLDMEITDDHNEALIGKTPIQVPDLTASLWLDYSFQDDTLEGLSVAAGVRHVGKSWADDANTLRVPAATLVDAAIRFKKDNWAVALNASNLFDKDYVASCKGANACAYGAGRTFMLKASTSW
ncbi:TonB-dependent siderophore receptor [Shinella kummerowiae]|uniref:TonB-dependent siderophore receptor n=1 Tax=Shinella kummerowiae TaxID=417745 RepID=UPI0021B4E6D2|nr:TonB-dependent siderophore receptor [Shinella kummerowiae]MCT7666268.1 TonB-dependent siderophore receptor [Shinella kummerowiae]